MEWCAPQPYRKSVSHRMLNRLAMRDSVPGTDLDDPTLTLPEGLFEADEIARYRSVLQRIAVPYKVTGRTRADRTELPLVTMTASGGLVSTVRDLATPFDKALDRRRCCCGPRRSPPPGARCSIATAAEPDGTRLVRPVLPRRAGRLALRLTSRTPTRR